MGRYARPSAQWYAQLRSGVDDAEDLPCNKTDLGPRGRLLVAAVGSYVPAEFGPSADAELAVDAR